MDYQDQALPKADVFKAAQPAITANYSAFVKVVERLEGVIEAETALLEEHKHAQLAEFNHRKRQGFLELSRVMRLFRGTEPQENVLQRLAILRSKLERNSTILQIHLRAVQEVAAIIARAIQDAESDGTYSITKFAERAGP
jgi:hypothetical protein